MIPAVNFGLKTAPSQPLKYGCSTDQNPAFGHLTTNQQPHFKGFAELGSAAVQRTQEGLQAAETRLKGLGQNLNLLA